MKLSIYSVFGLLFLFGCQSKTNNTEIIISTDDSSFQMYEMSEMAKLMEQMYVDNLRLKHKIEDGNFGFSELPEYYSRILTANFTDPSDLDDFYVSQAERFLELQKIVYTDTTNIKTNFNNLVSACIECHHVKCGLAIERIKKLYIK